MKIEAELGRDRSKKAKANGPRTIDLDLLWMDGETHGGKKLRLPHPLIGERDFVLVPLEDLIARPGAVLPLQRCRGQGARGPRGPYRWRIGAYVD